MAYVHYLISILILISFSAPIYSEKKGRINSSTLLAQNTNETQPTESTQTEPKPAVTYKLDYFFPKDLTRDLYVISIATNNPEQLINELNSSTRKIKIHLGDVKTDILKNTAERDDHDSNIVNVQVIAYSKLPSGNIKIKLFTNPDSSEENPDSVLDTEAPPSNDQPSKQPLIESLTPEGGIRGDTITVKGKNFGNSIDNIIIYFSETIETPEGLTTKELHDKKPFYLSAEVNEIQELKFNLPSRKDLLKGSQFRKVMRIQIVVGGRSSNYEKITMLPDNWKIYAAAWGVLAVVIVIVMLLVLLRNRIRSMGRPGIGGYISSFFDMILMDKATMSYSLSKFQAFSWTIVAVGSYIYVAISQGILIKNGKIPEFNATVAALMSISYGGLLAAGGLGAKKPKNEMKTKPPEFANLFCEGNTVDLPRLQLFVFTLVSIAVYLYNLANSNPLEGLPDIPNTLLGLMGASQTGYLGGKALGDKASVNVVTPNEIQFYNQGISISVIGSGFVEGMKVMFEGKEPIKCAVSSISEMCFDAPAFESPGKKSMTLLLPGAAPVIVEDALRVLEPDMTEDEYLYGNSSEASSESAEIPASDVEEVATNEETNN